MIIPKPQSIAYKALKILAERDGMCLSDVSKELKTMGYSAGGIIWALNALKESKDIVQANVGYVLNSNLQKYFDDLTNGPYIGEIVPRREFNVFATTLSKKYYLPVRPLRAGADDFRNWPSKQL